MSGETTAPKQRGRPFQKGCSGTPKADLQALATPPRLSAYYCYISGRRSGTLGQIYEG
jgi:hypothetical protein